MRALVTYIFVGMVEPSVMYVLLLRVYRPPRAIS